jgi:hypothetical protein
MMSTATIIRASHTQGDLLKRPFLGGSSTKVLWTGAVGSSNFGETVTSGAELGSYSTYPVDDGGTPMAKCTLASGQGPQGKEIERKNSSRFNERRKVGRGWKELR